MTVENFPTDPRRAVLAMEPDVTEVQNAATALNGLVRLINAADTDHVVDARDVVSLLAPIAGQLSHAAEELDTHHQAAHRALGGDRPLPGENDRRLCQLSEEHRRLAAEDRDELTDRERAVRDELLTTPADSAVGVAAKLAAVRDSRAPEPDAPLDKIEHRALAEIERLAGFGPQQQAAE